MTSVHFITLSFVTAVTSSNFVHSFPDTSPPISKETLPPNTSTASETTTLPPHQLAFKNCDFVADCNHMHGKIPIPCPDYCDRFLLCIDNRPTMQQCDPVKHWLFWTKQSNFNWLSLQCEEDFKTCDWYLTVRVSSSDEHETKSAASTDETSIGYDTTPIKEAADSAKDGLLNDLKKRANEVIQQVMNSTTNMVEQLKQKTEEISKQVQDDTLAILQQLKDEDAKNSTHVAQVVMSTIIDQIHLSSGHVKDGIASVVGTMKEKISDVLSSFQENATKEIESARESLHKVLPKPIEHVAEAEEPQVSVKEDKETAKADDQEEADKPVEPAKEKTVAKQDLNVEAVNQTSARSGDGVVSADGITVNKTKSAPNEEMMQGDDPTRTEVNQEVKPDEKKEVSHNKSASSPAVTSAIYLVAAASGFVVLTQFL